MNVIDFPQVDLGTEATISPDVDKAGEHLKTWSRATGIVLDGPNGDAFDALAQHRLAAWTYPAATGAELDLMADWIGWLFAFDDVFDESIDGCDQDFAIATAAATNTVYTGLPSAPPSPVVRPYVVALEDLWERTTQGMPAYWCRQLANDMVDYVNSYRSHALINASRIALDEQSYRAHRLIYSAVFITLDLCEAAARRALSESLLVHPYIRAAREAANNIVSWSNDLYSAPKELSLGDLCNYVAVLQSQDDLTTAQAADRVSQYLHEEIARFDQTKQLIHTHRIPRLPTEDQQGVISMLDTCSNWITGNVAWSLETARYASRAIDMEREKEVFGDLRT